MRVYNIKDIGELKKDNSSRIVALGFFDGIHLGHKEIIKKTVLEAKRLGKIATLITFDKSPKEFFTGKEVELLTPSEVKIEILKDLEVEEVYFLEFNEKLSKLTKEEFIEDVLLTINAEQVFCGEDYVYGNQGAGKPEYIESYTSGRIKVNIISLKKLDSEKISSTNLRNLIQDGKVIDFYKYTNRYYKISGVVVHGKKLGRTINFPTANLSLIYKFVVPKKLGVYITRVKVRNKYYKSITNIGKNPTVSDDRNYISIETHILDFDLEIYDEKIEVSFYEFLREEMKFESLSDLKKQLEKDKALAERYIIK